jgi:hypothetical protein
MDSPEEYVIATESTWLLYVWTHWPKPGINGAPKGPDWSLMGRLFSTREEAQQHVDHRKNVMHDERPHRIVRRDIIMTVESADSLPQGEE